MKWEDVDWDSKVLPVAEGTKIGTRPVPLGGSSLAVLKAQVRPPGCRL